MARRAQILALSKKYEDSQRAAYSNLFTGKKELYVTDLNEKTDKKVPDLEKLKQVKASSKPATTQPNQTEQTWQQSDDDDYDSRDEETKKLPFWKQCCSKKKSN